MKRRMVAVALAATMAISVAAGWLASARIRSPAPGFGQDPVAGGGCGTNSGTGCGTDPGPGGG